MKFSGILNIRTYVYCIRAFVCVVCVRVCFVCVGGGGELFGIPVYSIQGASDSETTMKE